jgi:hypothetical protein
MPEVYAKGSSEANSSFDAQRAKPNLSKVQVQWASRHVETEHANRMRLARQIAEPHELSLISPAVYEKRFAIAGDTIVLTRAMPAYTGASGVRV